jgi:hypothetical protein
MTYGPVLQLGPFNFTILRLLIAIGALRIIIRGERIAGPLNRLDITILAWAVWTCTSALFHNDSTSALVTRLGFSYNALGIYFLIRVFCRTYQELQQLARIACVLLLPVAVEMLMEKLTSQNLFSVFGGVLEQVTARDGKLRAQGPFAHPILAGTVGAIFVPIFAGIWRSAPTLAKIGLGSSLLMVLTSHSSGPLLTMAIGLLALAFWPWRRHLSRLTTAAFASYIALDLVMKAPAYYLMARIDLTGSSTGWYRAALIESAIKHLDEWWFAGTDITRHWMATGTYFSENSADIVNHYLIHGVMGGMPQLLLFVAQLWIAFRYVKAIVGVPSPHLTNETFLVWGLGACLLANAFTFLSVAYYDQSSTFIYLLLATISSLHGNLTATSHLSTPHSSDPSS